MNITGCSNTKLQQIIFHNLLFHNIRNLGCHLSEDREIICHCPEGYEGRNCERCSNGFEGNPILGKKCRPISQGNRVFQFKNKNNISV